MGHGIETTRDFVYGKVGQGSDWHRLTQEKENLSPALFPTFEERKLQTDDGILLPDWKCLITTDDNQMCGTPFTSTFGYILPGEVWGMVAESLAGTKYNFERIGMLWNRSNWFISLYLEELAEVSRPGEKFNVVICGGLDRSMSPQASLSHTRVVCANTLQIALKSGEGLFKVRQTGKSKERMKSAQDHVEEMIGMAKVFNATLAGLETKTCSKDTAREAYAGEVARHGGDFSLSSKEGKIRENRARNTVDELTVLFERGMGNTGQTRADVLNGATQFFTRGREDKKSSKDPMKQFVSSEFGGFARRKSSFLETLTDETEFTKLVSQGREALATK